MITAVAAVGFVVAVAAIVLSSHRFFKQGLGMRCCNSRPRVLSKCGEVEGSRMRTKEGQTILAFRGLPYAKPPVGNGRFRRSEPYGAWQGIWSGRKESKKCLQPNLLRPESRLLSEGSEDCLQLNVYTKNTDSLVGQPVIAFLHGGAFVVGANEAMIYGPQVLLDRDIVLVTINYRLGPLGWLSLETDAAPGNLGLHDQYLALKWIQENIAEFGGDPGRVTLMGQSAGSMSALLHHVSPLSKGLFHRVVALSGTPSSSFLNKDRRPRMYALEYAKAMGCTTLDDLDKVLEFLQSRPAEELLKHITLFKDFDYVNPMPWTPCVDDYASQPMVPMLYRDAVAAGQAGDVPVIMGCCSHEGLILTAKFFSDNKRWDLLTREWEVWAPLLLFNRERDETTSLDREQANQILNFHFQTKDSTTLGHTQDNVEKYTECVGMSWFLSPMDRDSQLIAKHGATVHTFLLTHPPNFTLFDIFRMSLPKFGLMLSMRGLFNYNPFKKVFGVCHTDDICYLFPVAAPGFPPTIKTDDQRQTQRHLLDMISSFAETGRAAFQESSVQWNPISETSCEYLEVGPSLRSTRDPDLDQKLEFWSGIKNEQEAQKRAGQPSSRPFTQLFSRIAFLRT